MKNKKQIKVIYIVLIVLIVIVLAYLAFTLYTIVKTAKNEEILNNAYIDVWEDISMQGDIDLYSAGTGIFEEIYLGNQPLHYVIHKDGKVYTYIASSYENRITGIRQPASVEYLKTLSQEELIDVENKLNSTIQTNESNLFMDINKRYWHVRIDESSFIVDVDVISNIIDK